MKIYRIINRESYRKKIKDEEREKLHVEKKKRKSTQKKGLKIRKSEIHISISGDCLRIR